MSRRYAGGLGPSRVRPRIPTTRPLGQWVSLRKILRFRVRFPIPRYAKRPDVALYTVGPLFLIPTPSSPHCALKVSEHDSLWQPPAAHSEERPRPQKSSRAQRCLDALAPGYLKGTVVRGHPVVWSLALRPDDAKQDPVVYGTNFGVVFLEEGPHTASIQKGFDCFGLYHPSLEAGFSPTLYC